MKTETLEASIVGLGNSESFVGYGLMSYHFCTLGYFSEDDLFCLAQRSPQQPYKTQILSTLGPGPC